MTEINLGYPEKVIDKDGIDGTGITVLRSPFKKADLAESVGQPWISKNPKSMIERMSAMGQQRKSNRGHANVRSWV